MKKDIEAIICHTLIEMMEKESFFKLTVSGLVKQANISRSTFYLYFDSLYEVIQKIEDDCLDGLLPEEIVARFLYDDNEKGAYDPSVISRAEYLKSHKRILSALLGENGDPLFVTKVINRCRRILDLKFKESAFKKRSEIHIMMEYIIAGQIQTFKWWLNHEEETNIYEMIVYMDSLTRKLLK